MLNFEGRIKEYNEFKGLFSKSTEGYKPKKKEIEEALNKVKIHLAIDLNDTNVDPSSPEKKKGLFGFFSKKK